MFHLCRCCVRNWVQFNVSATAIMAIKQMFVFVCVRTNASLCMGFSTVKEVDVVVFDCAKRGANGGQHTKTRNQCFGCLHHVEEEEEEKTMACCYHNKSPFSLHHTHTNPNWPKQKFVFIYISFTHLRCCCCSLSLAFLLHAVRTSFNTFILDGYSSNKMLTK